MAAFASKRCAHGVSCRVLTNDKGRRPSNGFFLSVFLLFSDTVIHFSVLCILLALEDSKRFLSNNSQKETLQNTKTHKHLEVDR